MATQKVNSLFRKMSTEEYDFIIARGGWSYKELNNRLKRLGHQDKKITGSQLKNRVKNGCLPMSAVQFLHDAMGKEIFGELRKEWFEEHEKKTSKPVKKTPFLYN